LNAARRRYLLVRTKSIDSWPWQSAIPGTESSPLTLPEIVELLTLPAPAKCESQLSGPPNHWKSIDLPEIMPMTPGQSDSQTLNVIRWPD
jgi:hypothetical protein